MSAHVWSPLEYACHVRDVVRLLGERVKAVRDQDDPEFADWAGDAKAVQLADWAGDAKAVQLADWDTDPVTTGR